MGIRLDAPPAPKKIAQNSAITVFRLIVPHAQSEVGAMKIVKEEIRLIANITTYSTDGLEMDSQAMTIPIEEVPAQGLGLLKQLYSWLEGQAESRGFVGAGTPEPLEKPEPPVDPPVDP